MADLIAALRERAEFEDKRVLDEAKAMGFVPGVYNGSQTGALLREAAAALEAAREALDREAHATSRCRMTVCARSGRAASGATRRSAPTPGNGWAAWRCTATASR